MEHTTKDNTIAVSGTLDGRCTAELRDRLRRALAEHDLVVLDLTDVESVDVTTLKLLAAASRTAQRQGRRLVLRGASSGVRRLLHLSHLRGLVALEPTPRLPV
ncbi:anti-anti-sigma factor [Nocardioides scoriae]|uniref:Anti-anti-sigma factor n=1 Tax=Nocardioides scoriae TaxID=642780 RepID=A0A1H1Y0B8_9ACTN|nr:STAS domain-containing protein [Nocardioides scoriae]SDT14795.1 anti-anti-sigma factor [Nocardioides scoriae]